MKKGFTSIKKTAHPELVSGSFKLDPEINSGNASRAGFTLVELSIVLVIIGLLVGGILVAQSLIDSVKIQSFARQMQQYESVINLFERKYRRLPGDSPLITPTGASAGNGNRILEATLVGVTHDGEVANFWPALQIGMSLTQDPTYIWNASSGIVHGQDTGSHIPHIDIGDGGGLLPYSNTIGLPNEMSDGYAFLLADYNGTSSQALNAGIADFATPVDALSIDTKLDDGAADSGFVQDADVAGDCATAAQYEVSDSDVECRLYIDMFITY